MTKRHESEPVKVSVTGRNMPVTDPIETYVITKMGKLDRYLDRLSQIDVVLSSDQARQASQRQRAEATAVVKGRVLRAEVTNADMYAAIDGLVDKLHLQLTRHKERTRAHKGRGPGDEVPVTADAEEPLLADDVALPDVEDEVEGDARRIVRVKQFALKPMFDDEAIEELEQLGHAFFVFLNAETEQVSVLYRRKDGAYGLIEPAFQ